MFDYRRVAVLTDGDGEREMWATKAINLLGMVYDTWGWPVYHITLQ